MKIYVIRHGETDANRKSLFQGTIDFPLNDFGKKLAILTGQAMKDIHFDICYCSPLTRARETAEILLMESGNNCPTIYEERIKEICAGIYEGKNISQISDPKKQKKIKHFFDKPDDEECFEEGESIGSVKKRTQEFLHELIQKNYDTVLVSTHGCAYRAMLNFLYDDPLDFWQGHPPFNCAVTVLETDGKVIKMIESDKLYYDRNLAQNFYDIR